MKRVALGNEKKCKYQETQCAKQKKHCIFQTAVDILGLNVHLYTILYHHPQSNKFFLKRSGSLMTKKRLGLVIAVFFYLLTTVRGQTEGATQFPFEQIDQLLADGAFSTALPLLEENLPTLMANEDWPALAHYYLWKGECLYDARRYQEALAVTEQAKKIVDEELDPKTFSEYSMLLQNLGVFHSRLGNFDKQMKAYQEGFTHSLSTKGRVSKEAADAYYNLGMAYLRRNQWNRTQAYLDTSLAIAQEINYQAGVTEALHILATCYANEGDYAKAIDYQRQSMKGRENDDYLSVKLNNLAEYQLNLKQFAQARQNFEQAIVKGPNNWGPRLNLIRLYNAQGDWSKAEQLTDQWINKILADPRLDRRQLKLLYNYKASIYIHKEDWTTAASFLEKAIETTAEDPIRDASIYLQLAKTRLGQREYQEALDAIQYAFSMLFPNENLAHPLQNPSLTTLLNAELSMELLAMKGRILRKMLLLNYGEDLEEATLALYRLAEELIAANRERYLNASSKSLLAQSAISLYRDAIELLYELYHRSADRKWVEQALYFSEKSRSVAVAERLNDIQAKLFTGLPAQLVAKENELLGDITFYSNQIADLGPYIDPKQLREWEQILFEKRKQQQELLRGLKSDFPQYFDVKYQSFDLKIDQIRSSLLSEDEVLLEYFVGNNELYLFWVSAHQAGLERLGEFIQIEKDVKDFRNTILSQDDSYFGSALSLYKTLLEPVQEQLIGKSLVIIPDGALGYIPFEALLTQAVDVESYTERTPFLLWEHPVRYFFSVQVALLGQEMKLRSTRKEIFGLSPDFVDSIPFYVANRQGQEKRLLRFPPLKGAIEELQMMEERFPGLYLYGSAATKSAFWKQANRHEILHIATHTVIDDQNPNASGFVLASTERDSIYSFLYAYELFNQTLLAELVTLSACNTGYGQIQQGEGIASLARAFAFAGCPNLVMTLWQIKDRATPQIMKAFYQNLTLGIGKDEALHLAKKDYLQTANPLFLHPYYWAGIIYVGDQNALPLNSKSGILSPMQLSLLILALMIVLFGYFRYRKIS